MTEKRILTTTAVLLLLVTAGYFLHAALTPDPHKRNTLAAHRIAEACSFHPECKVKLADLYDGDWDTLTSTGQDITLTRAGVILSQEQVGTGTEVPAPNELTFHNKGLASVHTVRYSRDTWLWATPYKLPDGTGTYYVLTPDDR